MKFQFPRLTGWAILAAALFVAISALAAHQLTVAVYKIALLVTAGVIGYWLDRSLFPYARPDGYLNSDDWRCSLLLSGKRQLDADLPVASGYELVFAAAMLRRALIVAAAIVGVAMGL